MSAENIKLTPKLSLLSVVVFGLAYMAPGIVMTIFGIISSTSDGTAPTAFALATAAMLLTALSYAKMAKIFPNSGSAYVYARRLLDSRVGFLVGWAILLDYLFLPTVAWLFQSFYLAAQFPGIPVWAWLALNAGLTTIINVTGIVLTDRVNKTLTLLVVTLIGIFIAYCLAYLGGNPPASFTDPFWNNATTVGGVAAAAAIAAYAFLGFDAVSTLSEETKNAQRNIPRAILLTVLVGGIIFVVVSYIMQLVHPGGDFEEAATAAYSMQVLVGGQFYANITNMLFIIGGFASGLAIQASTSRLLYVMGRDGVLPRTALRPPPPPNQNAHLQPGPRRCRGHAGTEHLLGNRNLLHQLRSLPGIHSRQPLRHRLLHPKPPARQKAFDHWLHRPTNTGRRRRHLPSNPAQSHRHHHRLLLDRSGRSLPRLPHQRIPQGTTRDGPPRP